MDLFTELVRTNFKLRYKGSALGFIWVLMKPFMMFLLLFVVFSKIGQSSSELSSSEYAVYLLLGIVIFNFFNEGLIWGMNSLLDKANIILKINFNRIIAVASSISLALVNLVINIAIVFTLAFIVGVQMNLVSAIYFVLQMFVLFLIILVVSLFSSIILIRLRDLTHITELVLQLVFYGSAVFYPADIIPEKWRFLIEWNPIAQFIYASRRAIVFGEVTKVEFIFGTLGITLILLFISWKFFNKQVKKIAEFF